jgi:hypothetical protein
MPSEKARYPGQPASVPERPRRACGPIRRHGRPWFFLTFCLLGLSAANADEAAPKPPLSVGAGVESFRWEEFSGGRRLLRETGPRLTVGATLDYLLENDRSHPYFLEGRAYLGVVDYDGQTQAGVAAKTDVDYFGFSAEGLRAWRLSNSTPVDLLAGLGLDTWERNLQDGTAADGSSTSGYREDYFIIYGKLGPGFLFQGETRRAYLQFGLKYPLITYERAYLSSVGFDSDVELEPGRRLSGYLKWRMNWGRETDKPRYGVTVYYDSFRLGASPVKTVTGGGTLYGVYQPESHMDVLGARFDYYF